jgi:hypothetical protein
MLTRPCRRGIETDARDRRKDIADHGLLRNPSVSHGAVPKLCSTGIWHRRWHLIDILVLKSPMQIAR